MDTHSPYSPEKRFQREVLGSAIDIDEIHRLNDEYMLPFSFIERDHYDEVDEGDVALVRKLYRASVISADHHLQRIVHHLERHNLRDDTIIVVTADHGEMLGQEDALGRRRMGHVDSVSDGLSHVPLLLANPHLDSERVDSLVNIKNVKPFLRSWSEGRIPDVSRLGDNHVIVENPGSRMDQLYEKHENIPVDVVDRVVQDDTVIGYERGSKLVLRAEGPDEEKRVKTVLERGTVSSDLRERCRQRLSYLTSSVSYRDAGVNSLENHVRDRLEDLGYLGG